MEGEDGDAVLVRQVIQVGVLMGVPTLIHHDFYFIASHFCRPAVDSIEAEQV